jgi:molybdate transport system ATP-binding protein
VSSAAIARPQSAPGGELHVNVCKSYIAYGNSHFRLEAKFKASPGVTILLGHSGAGKTTLLRCIAGLQNPEQGRIAMGDKVVFDTNKKICVEAAQRKIAFVFQDLALFPHLTVQQNVAYGLRRLDATERKERVDAILGSFRIGHLRKRLPRAISGGEQQRVALARSLVTEPSVLLLDEPLSSLDGRMKSSVMSDLCRWNEAHQIPIVYVTHNHEEVLTLGEKVIVLEQGRIVNEGSPLEIIPSHHREAMAPSSHFENLFDATVIDVQEQKGTVTCRLTGTSLELEAPLTQVALGARVRLGILSSQILVASACPEMISACHLARTSRLDALQRLFVFVCSGNTRRSPMAQAICNSLIAKRQRVPLELLADFRVQALSAGISAEAGKPMAKETEDALHHIGVSFFKHTARNLDAQMVERAEAIFCMTENQQDTVNSMFPTAVRKVHRLCADRDINDFKDPAVLIALASLLEKVIN